MKLAFCIEKNGGLSFFGKRLSRDQILMETLLATVSKGRILCSPKSKLLFGADPRCVADENYLNLAQEEDLCWLEFDEIPLSASDEIYLFCWNRSYPADRHFDKNRLKEDFKRIKKTDFQGSSHEKITLEIFKRK